MGFSLGWRTKSSKTRRLDDSTPHNRITNTNSLGNADTGGCLLERENASVRRDSLSFLLVGCSSLSYFYTVAWSDKRRPTRSLSLCRFLTADAGPNLPTTVSAASAPPILHDYSIMMAPLYQWCERMQRSSRSPSNSTSAAEGMWSVLTSCGTRSRERKQKSFVIFTEG